MDIERRSQSVLVSPAYSTAASDDPRLARLRDDLGARLGPTCAHLAPDVFENLLRDICATKLRWDPHALDRWRR